MSFDIDMKSFAGVSDQAAVDQQVVDTNSYGTGEEFPPVQDFLNTSPEEMVVTQEPQSNEKELNFRALADEVNRLKAEREAEKREYQLNLEMLRANMQQQPAPKSEPQKKMFDGMEESDVPNVGELRREWADREAGYQARLEELQVAQQHPDYAEVIEKFALPLVKEKPHLAEGIQGARNKALFAYELGKMAQKMKMNEAPTQSPIAQKIVDNSRKPGTLAQTGGQGTLSKSDYFATMSDADFIKFASKHLEEI